MSHSLPGTPASDETYLQSTEDAGSLPGTGRGPADPPPPRAGESLFSDDTAW